MSLPWCSLLKPIMATNTVLVGKVEFLPSHRKLLLMLDLIFIFTATCTGHAHYIVVDIEDKIVLTHQGPAYNQV